MSPDDGPAISYQVLARGTPVRSSDGAEVGSVRRVQEIPRDNLLDGLVISTSEGQRFVAGSEVERITERAVTLSLDAEQVRALPPPESRLAKRFAMSPTVRRLRRFGRSLAMSWRRR
jgi:hypothetical protein